MINISRFTKPFLKLWPLLDCVLTYVSADKDSFLDRSGDLVNLTIKKFVSVFLRLTLKVGIMEIAF